MFTVWLFGRAGQPFWLGMHETAQTLLPPTFMPSLRF